MKSIAALSGLLCAVLLTLGLWPVAGFFPPPSPQDSARFYAEHYLLHPVGVPLGGVLIASAASLYAPLFGYWSTVLRDLEGGRSGVWTFTLLISSAVASALFFLAGLLFGVAAFRPDQPEFVLRALNDLAWLTLVMPGLPATFQGCAIGCAVLAKDARANILPRWFGYLNLWFGAMFFPGMLVILFKTGPFAWDGLLAFWLPAILFCVWLVILSVVGWRLEKTRAPS